MRRIIDGKAYNTETADKLCEYWNGRHCSDATYESTDLYRTKKGVYFLSGAGGGLSRWALENGGDGGGLIVISESAARKFFEEHGDADDYEEVFGEVEEA